MTAATTTAGGCHVCRTRLSRLPAPPSGGRRIYYIRLVSSPEDLVATLSSVSSAEYVRFVADWLARAGNLGGVPAFTSTPVINALVAAAAAHAAFTTGQPVPGWANDPARVLSSLWYVGPDALFPNALVNSPLSFLLRGLLVEADSLASV